MVRKYFPYDRPTRYLEVGAGLGVFTRQIIGQMRPEDWLDIVETDHIFCMALRRQFGHLPNVAIHELSILDFEESDYDAVITSLPLNAFRAEMVDRVLKKYETLVKIGGSLSYFEYIGLEKLKKIFLFGQLACDFKGTLNLKRDFENKYFREIDYVWKNFPPARVLHFKKLNDKILSPGFK